MKVKRFSKKLISAALSLALVFTFVPATVDAAEYDTTVSSDYFTVISNNEYTLAPGVTETEMVLNNSTGDDRKVVHVMEVDTTEESVQVLPGYYGIDKLNPDDLAGDSAIWTDKALTQTVKYYENELGLNVVGAMNTALAYDSNAPYGYMVWNGVVLGTPEIHSGAQTYLAIYQDGTAELRSMSTPLDGNEWTAISANFGWLVKDGALTSTSVERTSSDASRSMIGIKADGTLVFCQVDGRNAPTSTGLSNYEMGEMMLSLGCVNAVNCDGGGSSTFITKREGTTENVMRSIPSDGSERATINSVIIVSTAQATGIFDHATVESDYDYYAAGATGSFSAKGVDTAGYPVEVPSGVSWQLSDASFGAVTDGVFTSNGTIGDVTVQMLYNGTVVGEKLIHIVNPEVFAFNVDSTVIPYGKNIELAFACTYGADDWLVGVDGAFDISLSDTSSAVLEGMTLTATTDESKKGVVVTATYKADTTKTAVMNVQFGKGSEVLFDFENGENADFMGIDEMLLWAKQNSASAPIQSNGNFSEDADSETFLATKSNGGQVKNGENALGVTLDYTNAQYAAWSYNMFFYTGTPYVLRDVANGQNATTFGMWVYIPEGAAGMAMQLGVYNGDSADSVSGTQIHFYFNTASGEKKNLNSCTEADIPESRWVYATADISGYNYVSLVNPMGTTWGREPSFIRFYVKPTEPADLTFYFDDFTLDYSSAVEDRVLPTITDIKYTTADEGVELTDGAVIGSNSVAFSATISDNTALDYTSGAIYVDGVALDNVKASGKVLASEAVKLLPGEHTVKFEIKDQLGNAAVVTRTITVSGDALITITGSNDSGKLAEYDSIYYVNVNTDDASTVDSLTFTLKLQTANTWETIGATVADGFEAEYDYNEYSRLLTVNLKKVGNVDATEQTLVSIPVRVWSWNAINHVTGEAITPETQFATGYCPIVSIDCDVIYGSAQLTTAYKNYLGAFGGTISVNTNLNDNVNPWHYHDAELTVLSKNVTCAEDGYADRTYCETCESVVDWGEITPATGHDFSMDDNNVLKCVCGELFTGEYTDGGIYVDGILFTDGWYDNSYYVDGNKLTGIQKVDGLYYDFGEDGVSTGALTGLFEMNGKTYYSIAGNLVKGWQLIDENWYFFNPSTFTGYNGTYNQDYFGINVPMSYEFENGKLVSGVWYESEEGFRYYYGPTHYKNEWATVDGNSYYFGPKGYRYVGYEIICPNLNSHNPIYELFHFAEDGVLVEKVMESGIFNADGDIYYLDNGVCQYAKLIKVDDDYYYFTSSYKAAVDVTRYIAEDCTNGLLPAGYYQFDAEGKMIVEEERNGVIDGYYYVDGAIQTIGLFKWEDNYYYASTTNGKIATNVYRYVAADCISESASDMSAGYYQFDADGKMVVKEVLNGVVDGYYYVDNVMQKIGLFKWEDNYYYASTTNGKIATNVYRYVAADCISESASDMSAGYYQFDADGKMVVKEVLNGVVDGYYYVDNVMQKIGLFKWEDNYYYASTTNGKIATNVYRYVAADCISESASDMSAGYYQFDADGKMVVEEVLNGVVDGYYYVDNVMQKIGLFKWEDNYYYASTTNGKIATNVYRYVAADCISESASDMSAGYYQFDVAGKLVQ